ncbi:hypothetical protein RJI07_07875 [Mycoplasmatota bacterium WC30]
MFRRIKETIKFEKENMPDYQYKFNYHFLFPFVFVFIIGPLIALAFSIPLGISGSKNYLLPIIIWACILFVMLVILIPYGKYVSKKVIVDQVNILNELTKVIDLKAVILVLEKKGICNNIGFFTVDENVIPFDDLRYVFVAQYASGKTFLSLVIHSDRYENDSFLDIDVNVYTLIKKKNFYIENSEIFTMFEKNKKAFMSKLLKRNSSIRFRQNDII